jgi:hypothetical protein
MTSRSVEMAAAEVTTTPGCNNFCIRCNDLTGVNTMALSQFVHLIGAGAPT